MWEHSDSPKRWQIRQHITINYKLLWNTDYFHVFVSSLHVVNEMNVFWRVCIRLFKGLSLQQFAFCQKVPRGLQLSLWSQTFRCLCPSKQIHSSPRPCVTLWKNAKFVTMKNCYLATSKFEDYLLLAVHAPLFSVFVASFYVWNYLQSKQTKN